MYIRKRVIVWLESFALIPPLLSSLSSLPGPTLILERVSPAATSSVRPMALPVWMRK